MAILIIGLIIFLGIHSTRIFTPGMRDRFIAERGTGAWRGLYSVFAIIGFVLIVWGYHVAHQTAPVLYVTNFALVHVTATLMLIAFIVLATFHMPAGWIKTKLKHPMLVAIKVWAVAHLLVNGDVASIVLFGSFLVWAIVDRISEKRRFRAGLTKNPTFVSYKYDAIAVVAGVVLYGLFVWRLHYWLIGVQPIA
ncbi:MAG: NnrU family protein [Pararhizobium sp.]